MILFIISLYFLSSYKQDCLKIFQLNNTKKIKKNYKKKPVEGIKIFLKKKRKKATIWS